MATPSLLPTWRNFFTACWNISAGHTFTADLNGGNESITIIGACSSGRLLTSPVVLFNDFTDPSYLQAHAGASIVVSAGLAGCDLLAFGAMQTPNETFTAGASWAIPTNGQNAGTGTLGIPAMVENIDNAAAGTYSGAFTSSGFSYSAGIIIALAQAAAASGGKMLSSMDVG